MPCGTCGNPQFNAPSPGNPGATGPQNNPQNAPTNQVGPYYKEIDTIPPGETRVVFLAVGTIAGTQQAIFTNPKSVTIEIPEVFIQSVGGNTVALFQQGFQLTPPLELADGIGYTDGGFLLAAGQSVSLLVSAGGGVINGFVRWRYQ